MYKRQRVHLYRGCIIETGPGGSLTVGQDTHIQPRCQFTAFAGPIRIGDRVQIAPNCSFYPYDHSLAAGKEIGDQDVYKRQVLRLRIDALNSRARLLPSLARDAESEGHPAEALAYLQLQNDLSQHLLILKRTLNVRTYAGRRQTAPSL